MFFSEEDELVQDDDEEAAQKEIMDSHSSVIAETIRKVSMCHQEIYKSVLYSPGNTTLMNFILSIR